ncbi:MAG TPA: hypothetical protein VLA21_10895 [Candidatus Limnocylindria bacterium]|nr:hypothetical protein [Candidatus Limnocylindria bacterium]
MKRLPALVLALLLITPLFSVHGEALSPREDFIGRIILSAQGEFDAAGGRALRAADASDRYVCKNFTTWLFRKHRDAFRMAEYPGVQLRIPDNLPREESKPYVYGAAWMDVKPEEGNPFFAAAEFRYDKALSRDGNRSKAREMLMQARRGDFFQMAADYYYGVGAHSLIFIADYDAATDTVRWTDSNMKGKKVNGVRHGYIQFDAVKDIDWFVDAFCRKGYGATLYRLRDDIVYAP